ncbi:MAG: antitoxin component YwqK of YwqJK toxin-antitoxin module, partial [Arenicella sp.]
MKIGLILLLLFSISTYSQKSTNYHGEELKVYPFKQKAGIQFNSNYWNRGTKKEIKEHSKEYGFNLYDSGKDIFLPLGTIADGKYIQMVDQDHTFEYTGIKEKRLNFHENEIPYAIFNVSGNKLNGPVYFLSPIGDTITKGFYKNNMRHGKWNIEPTNQNVITYNEGLYHGEYKFYYKYNSRKKRSNKRIKTEFFDNDDLVSSVELYSGKDEENIVTKKLMDPNIKNQFSVVAKKNGNIDYQGSYEGERETGNWKYYYPNGALKANVQFTDDTTYLGESFVRWYNQIFNFKPHTAFDIHG